MIGYSTDYFGHVPAARWAGYNWSPWRASTKKLTYGPDGIQGTSDDDYYSILIDDTRIDTDLKPGDILSKPSAHVVTVYNFAGHRDQNDSQIIEASSSKDKVRVKSQVNIESQYLTRGYKARRLVQH
ncbi:MAG: hypothetical protein NC913_04455 [Candidatus Omnitrophica bacterium]|nr:hypothetical protein [Candidatus Omnitrophota bacterium]